MELKITAVIDEKKKKKAKFILSKGLIFSPNCKSM